MTNMKTRYGWIAVLLAACGPAAAHEPSDQGISQTGMKTDVASACSPAWASRYRIVSDYESHNDVHSKKDGYVILTHKQGCTFDAQLKSQFFKRQWKGWPKKLSFVCKPMKRYFQAQDRGLTIGDLDDHVHHCMAAQSAEPHKKEAGNENQRHDIYLFFVDPQETLAKQLVILTEHTDPSGGLHGGYAHGVQD